HLITCPEGTVLFDRLVYMGSYYNVMVWHMMNNICGSKRSLRPFRTTYVVGYNRWLKHTGYNTEPLWGFCKAVVMGNRQNQELVRE
ncbi:MAG: hypothetical protein K9K37_07455, partial [Desulfocapsa sp.]|nr:hypothetical protein [Desulfocapsa sp.]